MSPKLVFCVSGHGYGHAVRVAALMVVLRERAPDLELHVRSAAPDWIFRDRDPRTHITRAELDPGVVQTSGLDIDLRGTLAAHEAFVAGWEAAARDEAAFLRDLGADLVVADIPPLAFAAADLAGIPAVGIANFSWDWIFSAYTGDEPRWRPIVARYREAYAGADALYRLPLCGDLGAFPEIHDAPLLVHTSRHGVAACRARLGLDPEDARRLVLVSFGGFGASGLAAAAGDDLSDYLFLGIGPPPAGFSAAWHALPRPTPLPHEDLMQAADAILGKSGYSTVAEAIAHDTRFLYLSRDGFSENAVLEAGLARHTRSRAMPRPDFESGRWRPHLDALFALPDTSAPLATHGAEFLADALLARLASH